jgi:hypothetical protein
MIISDWEHEKNALLLEDLQEEVEKNKKLKAELAALHDCFKVVKNQRNDSMRVAAELKTELAYLLGKDTRNSQQIAELKTANLSLKTDYQLYLKMNPSTI